MQTEIDITELVKFLRGHFRLNWHGHHGAAHWARVMHNGKTLAKAENGRQDVVTLFALLHDHERENEFIDPSHGQRAADNAVNLRNRFFKIDDAGFLLLYDAMALHSQGDLVADSTVQCCWDADRLDLGRVGIIPDPRYLCTATAKQPDYIRECYARSVNENIKV